MWSAIWNVFFPLRCPSCGLIVDQEGFCGDCSQWVETDSEVEEEWVAGEEASDGSTALGSQPRRARPIGVRAAFVYEGAVRDALVRFKNSGRLEAGRSLARLALFSWAELGDSEATVVVPVGSHPRRVRQRGYNPAAIVAQEVAKYLKVPLAADALERSNAFLGQKGKRALQRQEAVAGAFKVRRADRMTGQYVLLVDDVVTTGATVGECRKVLLEAGAASVEIWVVARAL